MRSVSTNQHVWVSLKNASVPLDATYILTSESSTPFETHHLCKVPQKVLTCKKL